MLPFVKGSGETFNAPMVSLQSFGRSVSISNGIDNFFRMNLHVVSTSVRAKRAPSGSLSILPIPLSRNHKYKFLENFKFISN
ncbi:MAG: hypothetical protein IPL24_05915 [Bacteroidetes bacterium]|nr:hypothetical protein [Bacteroidota bacterium]